MKSILRYFFKTGYKPSPEAFLFLNGLFIGIQFMCMSLGIFMHMPDLIVVSFLFLGVAVFNVYLAWKECSENRFIADAYIATLVPEVKKLLEEIIAEEPEKVVIESKLCPPHNWNTVNGRFICLKCNKKPLAD